jgi:cation transport regulator ChaC
MGDSDWEQVNIRLQPERKERWTSAVSEDTTYENLTHLIRLSVEKELKGEHDVPASSESTAGEADTSGEVLTTLNRIERSVENMDDRLSALEQESEAENKTNRVLRNAIFEILPAESELEGGNDYGMTAEEIAKTLGVEPGEVSYVIDRMQTSQIQSEQLPSQQGDPDDAEQPTVYYRRG